jgi:hypothetical protein
LLRLSAPNGETNEIKSLRNHFTYGEAGAEMGVAGETDGAQNP